MDSGLLGSLIIFLPVIALFLFVVFSQRRRQRDFANLQAGLRVGDEVMTTSGLYGRIAAIDDAVIVLDVGNGVQLRFDRRAVSRTTPPPAAGGPVTPAGE